MCVTLSSKINRQGHMICFNIFDIHDLENVRIDTKINFVSCLQPEIRKVMQKDVWPWFSRSCNEDRIFSLSPLDSLTPKTYPWEIFLKNSDGKAKIQVGVVFTPLGGWYPPPLGRFRLAKYLGHLRVKKAESFLFFGSSVEFQELKNICDLLRIVETFTHSFVHSFIRSFIKFEIDEIVWYEFVLFFLSAVLYNNSWSIVNIVNDNIIIIWFGDTFTVSHQS